MKHKRLLTTRCILVMSLLCMMALTTQAAPHKEKSPGFYGVVAKIKRVIKKHTRAIRSNKEAIEELRQQIAIMNSSVTLEDLVGRSFCSINQGVVTTAGTPDQNATTGSYVGTGKYTFISTTEAVYEGGEVEGFSTELSDNVVTFTAPDNTDQTVEIYGFVGDNVLSTSDGDWQISRDGNVLFDLHLFVPGDIPGLDIYQTVYGVAVRCD